MTKLLLLYVLPIFSWRRRWSPETESRTLDGTTTNQQSAVEFPESVLLQHAADLESGSLETPPLTPQAPELPAEDVVAAIDHTPPLRRQRLPTETNQASGVTEEQLDMELRHREHTASSLAKLKEYLTLSLLIVSVATGILINLFFIRSTNNEHLSEKPSLIVACASAFVSLISGFSLAIDTMKQMTTLSSLPTRHGLVRDSPCSWSSKLFLSLSVASITFTVISIIVSFLPKTYYYLPFVLMPAFLVLGVSFYGGRRQRRNLVGDADADNDKRERSFQLAVNMTGFSFAGALSTIIGYHKNYSNRANHVYVIVSIYLMLGASITGLLVLLLSRLRRIDWKKAAVGNAIMLCLLVLGVLIVATTFLGAVLAGTLFPVVVAAAIWYLFEYHVRRGSRDLLDAAFSLEEELKLLYSGALTVISVSFGAVMTTFAGFLGGQAKGCSVEVFIFFVLSCFVSSVTLGVITYWTPKKASLGAAARALACITLVLFVLAGLAMVSYVG